MRCYVKYANNALAMTTCTSPLSVLCCVVLCCVVLCCVVSCVVANQQLICRESVRKGYQLMEICAGVFCASEKFRPFLEQFLEEVFIILRLSIRP